MQSPIAGMQSPAPMEGPTIADMPLELLSIIMAHTFRAPPPQRYDNVKGNWWGQRGMVEAMGTSALATRMRSCTAVACAMKAGAPALRCWLAEVRDGGDDHGVCPQQPHLQELLVGAAACGSGMACRELVSASGKRCAKRTRGAVTAAVQAGATEAFKVLAVGMMLKLPNIWTTVAASGNVEIMRIVEPDLDELPSTNIGNMLHEAAAAGHDAMCQHIWSTCNHTNTQSRQLEAVLRGGHHSMAERWLRTKKWDRRVNDGVLYAALEGGCSQGLLAALVNLAPPNACVGALKLALYTSDTDVHRSTPRPLERPNSAELLGIIAKKVKITVPMKPNLSLLSDFMLSTALHNGRVDVLQAVAHVLPSPILGACLSIMAQQGDMAGCAIAMEGGLHKPSEEGIAHAVGPAAYFGQVDVCIKLLTAPSNSQEQMTHLQRTALSRSIEYGQQGVVKAVCGLVLALPNAQAKPILQLTLLKSFGCKYTTKAFDADCWRIAYKALQRLSLPKPELVEFIHSAMDHIVRNDDPIDAILSILQFLCRELAALGNTTKPYMLLRRSVARHFEGAVKALMDAGVVPRTVDMYHALENKSSKICRLLLSHKASEGSILKRLSPKQRLVIINSKSSRTLLKRCTQALAEEAEEAKTSGEKVEEVEVYDVDKQDEEDAEQDEEEDEDQFESEEVEQVMDQ